LNVSTISDSSSSTVATTATSETKKQFEALRDGDRFFFANDPVLSQIGLRYGVSVGTPAEVIAANSDAVTERPFAAA
jgi:hypothetical protein